MFYPLPDRSFTDNHFADLFVGGDFAHHGVFADCLVRLAFPVSGNRHALRYTIALLLQLLAGFNRWQVMTLRHNLAHEGLILPPLSEPDFNQRAGGGNWNIPDSLPAIGTGSGTAE